MMNRRVRLNGKELSKHVGERVTLLCTVTKVGSSGRNIECESLDHVKVNVSLPEDYTGGEQSLVEIHGTVNSRSTISADSYVLFDEDIEEFDSAEYCQFLTIRDFKISSSKALKNAFGVE